MARKQKPTPADGTTPEDDEIVVLCFKVLMNPISTVPGSTRRPCSECNQPVWISPATAAHVADKKHRICCAECMAKRDDGDTQIMTPSPGQLAEIVAHDPSLTKAKVLRKFPASNPAKRKASFDDLIRRTKARKRLDN